MVLVPGSKLELALGSKLEPVLGSTCEAQDGISVVVGKAWGNKSVVEGKACLLYTSPSPRDATLSRMPSSA